MTRLACFSLVAIALVAASGAAASNGDFPTGTFLTKITPADLYRAGLDPNDAHWDKLTVRPDGTWVDIWFHPRVPDQPPARGRYVVRGDTVRFLGTPDTVRWHYDGHALTFTVIHVPDRLARLGYAAHPWQRIHRADVARRRG
jgi:hypothetical protein